MFFVLEVLTVLVIGILWIASIIYKAYGERKGAKGGGSNSSTGSDL